MIGANPPVARWRTSSYSGGGNEDNCVELARTSHVTALRDSKAPSSGALSLSPRAWSRLSERLG